jgi:hypothetical protein
MTAMELRLRLWLKSHGVLARYVKQNNAACLEFIDEVI